jgi:arylsulfatase A-like enzyme
MALLIPILVNGDTEGSPPSKPNVVLVMIDDLNDWVGFQNKSSLDAITPNMDRLANEGMVFSNAHCSAPECAPSRTSLISGLEPWTTGIYYNRDNWMPSVPIEQMLPAVMKANGYHAAGGGKIHHHVMGFNPPEQWHEYFAQVFEDYWTREKYKYARGWQKTEPRPKPLWLPLNGLAGEFAPTYPDSFDWGTIESVEKNYHMGDTQMVDWAVDFLSKNTDQPFFLAVGIYKPHLPWYAPKEFFDLYDESESPLPEVSLSDLDDVPPIGRTIAAKRGDDFHLVVKSGQYKKAVRAYRAAISYADSQVGRILDALGENQLEMETIVILTSDHGWHLGEKLHWHKSTLWERATHVPLIIIAPGMTRAGSVSYSPVGLIDIYPTIMDLCEIAIDHKLDGHSLRNLFEDDDEFRIINLSTFITFQHPLPCWKYFN